MLLTGIKFTEHAQDRLRERYSEESQQSVKEHLRQGNGTLYKQGRNESRLSGDLVFVIKNGAHIWMPCKITSNNYLKIFTVYPAWPPDYSERKAEHRNLCEINGVVFPAEGSEYQTKEQLYEKPIG